MNDTLSRYEETKQFELYLLVKNRILSECQQALQVTLLQQLDKCYVTGGNNEELLSILWAARS